jgi:oligoendopeptidase F
MKNQTLPPRSEISIQETWNLENVFPDVKSWEKAMDEVLSLVPELADYKGRLSKNAKTLADFFELFEHTLRLAGKVAIYGSLASAVDTSDQEAQARAGQGQSVYVRLNAATAFLNPELMSIGFDTLRQWLHEDDRLSRLEHFLNKLEREKDHVRSNEVEEVLALSGEPLSDFFRAYTMLTNADLKFNDAVDSQGRNIEVGQSSINALLTNQDRDVRKSGFNNYADGYLAYKNTIASIQLGGIHRDIFNARARIILIR